MFRGEVALWASPGPLVCSGTCFLSGFGTGRGCPYSECTLLQQAEDTGSSGFHPHLALGALAEATMRRSGHTGTSKGTEGLSCSLSLSTFSTLQPEQSPQLPVTPESTIAPPGTSVSSLGDSPAPLPQWQDTWHSAGLIGEDMDQSLLLNCALGACFELEDSWSVASHLAKLLGFLGLLH